MSAIPIVALDYSSTAAALRLVDRLGSLCAFYKVGNELFTAAGPAIVTSLRERGAEVFLDLKFHDIPNTVSRAVKAVSELGAALTTVHATGGSAMLEAAAEAGGESCGVFAVTVLTSLDAVNLAKVWGRRGLGVEAEVLRLAQLASRAGVRGVVCSGQEATAVRSHHPGLKILLPGIRLAGDSTHDQARVMTVEAASAAGATYIVLGRAVTRAEDPVRAMTEVNGQLQLERSY